ncbi:MAG: MFS transporter [Alphaproteobacteria bacterium]|nr:MFS transporter [Alphaproteobacteria bacterium]
MNSSSFKEKSATYAWIIWGAAALFYLYEYVLRASPGVMTNELMRDFGVTSTALGIFTSAYYFSYVPLQVPCGMIVDWLGTRRVVTISAVMCALGSFVFAESESLFTASAARFLMGAGSACAYLSCLKIASEWFPAQRFAVIAGITMMMGTFGGFFGGKPLAMLVNATDWRIAMTIAGSVGVAVAAAAWMIIRDHPTRGTQNKNQDVPMTTTHLWEGLRIITSSPQTWLIGLYASLMYTILSAFAEMWGTPYLMVAYEINNETAAYGSMLVFMGMALGCLVSPILANYLCSHKKVMSIGALGALATFMPAVYINSLPLYSVFGLLFCAGFFCGWQILNFAAAKEINPPEFNGTTMGFMNCLTMASALVFQPLLGWLIDLFEEGEVGLDGVKLYSVDAYHYALVAIPLSLLLAWVILRFVRETHPDYQSK